MSYKAATFASALWSLEGNRRQDPIIDKKIKQIITKNPQLDYWKKIHKAING